MTIDRMRCTIAEAYPGPKWKLKVAMMPDNQVLAVYKSMRSNGYLYKHHGIKKKEPGVKKAVQTSIFDLLEKEG